MEFARKFYLNGHLDEAKALLALCSRSTEALSCAIDASTEALYLRGAIAAEKTRLDPGYVDNTPVLKWKNCRREPPAAPHPVAEHRIDDRADEAAVDHESARISSVPPRRPVGIVAAVSMNTIWKRKRAKAAVS